MLLWLIFTCNYFQTTIVNGNMEAILHHLHAKENTQQSPPAPDKFSSVEVTKINLLSIVQLISSGQS